ncbi:alpha/beta hydrolase-fold protein [Kribbella yunnanensis]|uniref:Alpha/beta hydrolase-fold protein n=1 Tax=Kribbella yunnanensis TaxID=190194 RepID=A0ABN2J5H2_9ACTN
MTQIPVAQILGNTDYFEIDSAAVGGRFGIWVTTSPNYADDEERYPALYVTDGNFSVGQTAPLAVMQSDVLLPIAPYLQVTVGYTGAEADDWSRVRNRDLVPPGEPLPPDMRSTLDLAVERGAMTQAEVDAYLAELATARADAFLTFLTDELHPEVCRRYRVAPTGHGLFGYSYGGLFTLYALLSGSPLFSKYGAGSPGVASFDSTVLKLADAQPDLSGTRLHVTLNDVELTGQLPIYRMLGRGSAQLIDSLRASETGVTLTAAVLEETHATGLQASFLSFMRACYGATS